MKDPSKRLESLLSEFETSERGEADAVFRPTIFEAATQHEELAELLASGAVRTYRDAYLAQLRELGITRHADDESFAAERAETWVKQQLGSDHPAARGVYVYYPWSGALVHLIGRAEFFELRTNRNRYKITEDEQAALFDRTIGIVGLSVGHAAATTLALEGIGGRFRLADYDQLDLSNLNRIRSRLEMLGLNKCMIAARELFELNPFLEIDIFPQGIDSGNIDDFLSGPPPLDLLVEECDDFFAKLRLREKARDLRIPVVMDTSDRGMLDIELFDREPDRPVFHGLLAGLTAEDVRGLSTKEKVPYVLKVLGEDKLSARLAASMLEVKQSIYTWPQLGSAVALGGALVAHSTRGVLLGQITNSGRYYVDLDEAVGGGDGLARSQSYESQMEVPSFHLSREVPRDADRLTQVRWMVAAAHLAPSGGNQQPWRFVLGKNGTLLLRADANQARTFLDYDGLATEVALGAATENLTVAATHLGLRTEVSSRHEDGQREIRFIEDASCVPDALLEAIPKRVTERRHDAQPTISSAVLERIVAAGKGSTSRLILKTERAQVERIADIVAAADRFTYLHPETHRQLMSELRWSDVESIQKRDGIRVDELKLTPFDEAGLRLARRPDAIRLVKEFGGGEGVGKLSRNWFRASSAVGLFVANDRTKQVAFSAGRGIQRAWLTATANEVGLHPLTALLYLGMRAELGHESLRDEERGYLTELLAQVRDVFGAEDKQVPLFLCRLTPAAATPRHLRLDLDAIFSSE